MFLIYQIIRLITPIKTIDFINVRMLPDTIKDFYYFNNQTKLNSENYSEYLFNN